MVLNVVTIGGDHICGVAWSYVVCGDLILEGAAALEAHADFQADQPTVKTKTNRNNNQFSQQPANRLQKNAEVNRNNTT